MKKFLLAISTLLFLSPMLSHAIEEGDLLDPEKAFALTAKILDAKTVIVR